MDVPAAEGGGPWAEAAPFAHGREGEDMDVRTLAELTTLRAAAAERAR